ncbi:MAG: class I SAM-dependent methyltransferase [Candidatus Bathyarchaeia archaeon]
MPIGISLTRILTSLADIIRGRNYYGRYKKMYKKDLRKIPSIKLVLQITHGRVLDVGCGIGYLSAIFKDYVGVDINREAILIASKNTHGDYVIACASNLPFRSDAFDACISYDCIEHLEHVEQALAEMARVANEVVISCVDFSSYYRFFTYDKSHRWLPTPQDLLLLLKKFFTHVQIFKTSGIFVLPHILNVFLERFLPNQVVLKAWRKRSCLEY